MSIQPKLDIVIIEDDASMIGMLEDFFQGRFPTAQISIYKTGEDALNGIFKQPDLVVLDYHLDSMNPTAMNGLQILTKLKDRYKDIQVVFLSAQESTEIAANTVKFGAFDYILKNQQAFHRLEVVLRNILGQAHLKKNLGTQRFFNFFLAIVVVVLLIGLLVRRMES